MKIRKILEAEGSTVHTIGIDDTMLDAVARLVVCTTARSSGTGASAT